MKHLTRRKGAVLLILILFIGLVGAGVQRLHTQQRQYALNRQLMAAVVKNDTKQAIMLIDEGADPNTRYKPSPVPSLQQLWNQLLHRAPPPANDSPTAFLIACGADWDIVGNTRRGLDCPSLVQAMLAHGANLNTRERLRMTPLICAVVATHSETLRVLLHHETDINAQDQNGRTALSWATRPYANNDIIRQLLAHGAAPNLKDNFGSTPLTRAKVLKRPEIVALLQNPGMK